MTASHLPGAQPHTRPPYRARPVSPRVALRAVLVGLALVLLVVLLAGCGNAELPRAAAPTPTTGAPSSTSPTTRPTTGSATPSTEGRSAGPPATSAPQASPRTGGGGSGGGGGGGAPGTGGRGTPIWPVTDAASAASLQKQVDGGRQPWLLDPTEVATSYSGVALNYRNPTLYTLRPGVIDVQDGATRNQATITLAQTVRKGDGGIWVVTDVRRR